MLKDKDFYNAESVQYSAKRYPKIPKTYVQYFFTKRLAVTLDLLRAPGLEDRKRTLLEIGCADGVVLRNIVAAYGSRFSVMTGIDTAPEMIEAARALTEAESIEFFVRGNESHDNTYDDIVEVGVANYTDFDAELEYAKKHLVNTGQYILSIAGSDSTNRLFGQGRGYENCFSYREYEKRIQKYFIIEKIVPVGLYFPVLWRMPFLARTLLPLFELILRPLIPNAFHEKVYLLKLR